jgi:CheY-like chemotaxis protein
MPVMDGVVATRHVRTFEQEHSLSPVTIFAVTGVGSTEMRQQALASGVDDYLMKPLSLKQLDLVMKRVQPRSL